MNQDKGRYRVVLIGIGDNTEERKEAFCKKISERYGISYNHLNKIIDQAPIILRKNLSLKKAITLFKILKSFGANILVEERVGTTLPVFLEFEDTASHCLVLESSQFQSKKNGSWQVIGRVQNISKESLNDILVLVQLFDSLEELITFEEVPISINPLPPGGASPFKAAFEEDLPAKRVSITFKNSSGYPLSTLDKRKKMEWAAINIENKLENFPSVDSIPQKEEEKSQSIEISQTPPDIKFFQFQKDVLAEKESIVKSEGPQSIELEIPSLIIEERTEMVEIENENKSVDEPLPSEMHEISLGIDSEKHGEKVEVALVAKERDEAEKREDLKTELNIASSQLFSVSMLKEGDFQKESFPSKLDHVSELREKNIFKDFSLDASIFEEASQLLENISGWNEQGKDTKSLSFPWLEDFRNAIESYFQKPIDLFSIWFNEQNQKGTFEDAFHSLLSILAHARFDQMCQSEKALENTKRIFKIIAQPNLRREEIPILEGTQFLLEEKWSDLFYKSIPKLHEIARNIIQQIRWKATDLERLIQIIPHMSEKTSRAAVLWINQLVPDVVEIDFSNTTVLIGESLYRVASRLGVLNPNFDFYQGKNSTGDLKIQSFAKTAFPHYPQKIEEPMTRMGIREEEGGHCFPTNPRCEGCLFENFCQKLYNDFNPSEKGIT